MPKKKKEVVLHPKEEEYGADFDLSQFENLVQANQDIIIPKKEKGDEIFKEVARSLDDKDKISMNTEYLSVKENFNGAKLEYIGRYGLVPSILGFVNTYETKRVSFKRKGRQEKVMIMQERTRQIEKEKMRDLASSFGVN